MAHWLDPVRSALDSRTAPMAFFIRDDDAGWDDERLFKLLDVVHEQEVAIDLAAIPAAVTAALGGALRKTVEQSDRRVRVHQHGFAHANHELIDRKCEFGPSRSVALQRADIAAGRRKLEDAIGAPLEQIFTPPWNRCTLATAEVLVELRYEVLSRDVSAQAFGVNALRELPVHLDWSGRHGMSAGPGVWGDSIARVIAGASAPIGLMLHHEVMTSDDRRFLGELLGLIGKHPQVIVRAMIECARQPRASSV